MPALKSKYDLMQDVVWLKEENQRLSGALAQRDRVLAIMRRTVPVNVMAAERREEAETHGGKG